MATYDPAGAKRKRKQALTHKKQPKDYIDPHVRGRARLKEQGPVEEVPVYDPAGAKKRRKQALTPSTLDPVE
jgi:hypothetical protein